MLISQTGFWAFPILFVAAILSLRYDEKRSQRRVQEEPVSLENTWSPPPKAPNAE